VFGGNDMSDDHVRDMSLIRENELLKQKVQWNYERLSRMEARERTFQDEIHLRDGQIAALVSDIGVRDDFIQRLMQELSQHGWGDMHYSNNSQQDPNIVALLEEGGFQYERGSDQSGKSPEEAGT
jgi:hypothetical protein